MHRGYWGRASRGVTVRRRRRYRRRTSRSMSPNLRRRWAAVSAAARIVSKRASRILSRRCIGCISYYFGLFCRCVMRCLCISLERFAEVSRLGFMRRVCRTRGVTRRQRTRRPRNRSKILGQDLDKIGRENTNGLVSPQSSRPPRSISRIETFY